jgi:hypothetical protein
LVEMIEAVGFEYIWIPWRVHPVRLCNGGHHRPAYGTAREGADGRPLRPDAAAVGGEVQGPGCPFGVRSIRLQGAFFSVSGRTSTTSGAARPAVAWDTLPGRQGRVRDTPRKVRHEAIFAVCKYSTGCVFRGAERRKSAGPGGSCLWISCGLWTPEMTYL